MKQGDFLIFQGYVLIALAITRCNIFAKSHIAVISGYLLQSCILLFTMCKTFSKMCNELWWLTMQLLKVGWGGLVLLVGIGLMCPKCTLRSMKITNSCCCCCFTQTQIRLRRAAHWALSNLQRARSVATVSASSHGRSTARKSSMNVRRHVFSVVLASVLRSVYFLFADMVTV